MSQQQFDQFMQDQISAIELSGLPPEEWVEQFAESFRTEWEAAHDEE